MFKKWNKKVTAMLLASAMVLGMAACGQEDAKTESKVPESSSESKEESKAESSEAPAEPEQEVLEPVHLVVFLNQTSGTADAKVAEAINNLDAMKAINTTVEFITVPEGDKFDQKLNLALAAGEDIDVVLGDLSPTDRIRTGAYADITELLTTKYTDCYNSMPDFWWALSEVDGKYYGVPAQKEPANNWGFFISKKFVEENNIDLTNRNLSNIDDILQALKDDGRETFMMNAADINYFNNITISEYFVSLGSNLTVVRKDDPTKVVNYYATDEYLEMAFKAQERYKAGLIDKNVLTVENYNAALKDETKYGLQPVNHMPLAETERSVALGFDVEFLPLTEYITAGSGGFMSCVTAKSKNADRAVAFIELLATNAEVKNTLTFGVEGLTYDLTDGQVDYTNYPEHAKMWGGENAKYGNMMISYTLLGEPKDKYDSFIEVANSPTTVMYPVPGFKVDFTSVANEKQACDAIRLEYQTLFSSGTLEDVEAQHAEFMKKFEAAGIQKVLDEVQKQLDAYWASK